LTWSITSLVSHVREERQLVSAADALESTAKRARAKDAAAEYELARRYREGAGMRVDELQSRIWLERAAEHGHTQAQLELGLAFLKGDNVPQDFQSALKWLTKAAEGGNSQARYNLGLLYKNGIGIPADNVKAYTWLNLAAAQGIEAAVAARDATMRLLSSHEIAKAQSEARRLSGAPPVPLDDLSLEAKDRAR
jgi:TPR repeat protein